MLQLGGFGELHLNNFDISNPWKFRGGGQDFNLKANLGSRRKEYALGWTDPQFLGYPLSFGVDIFTGSTDGFFGRYGNRDRLYTEVRYDF